MSVWPCWPLISQEWDVCTILRPICKRCWRMDVAILEFFVEECWEELVIICSGAVRFSAMSQCRNEKSNDRDVERDIVPWVFRLSVLYCPGKLHSRCREKKEHGFFQGSFNWFWRKKWKGGSEIVRLLAKQKTGDSSTIFAGCTYALETNGADRSSALSGKIVGAAWGAALGAVCGLQPLLTSAQPPLPSQYPQEFQIDRVEDHFGHRPFRWNTLRTNLWFWKDEISIDVCGRYDMNYKRWLWRIKFKRRWCLHMKAV